MLAPQHHYAQINGFRMHYVQAGAGERLIVLLHGFPESWYAWRYQIAPLAAYGTVVAPDLRGYGESGRPGGSYGIDTLVADVAALVGHLGRRQAVLVGHDWGGAIAWAAAIARPDLVERLAVLAAPHLALFGPGARMSAAQLRRSAYIALFQLPWLPELLLRRGGFAFIDRFVRAQLRRPAAISDDDLRVIKQSIARPGALHAALQYYRHGLRRTGGIFRGTGLRVRAPTLMIWPADDAYFGAELLAGTERFVPRLTQRIVQASHWVQQDAADEVTALLAAFLEEESHG